MKFSRKFQYKLIKFFKKLGFQPKIQFKTQVKNPFLHKKHLRKAKKITKEAFSLHTTLKFYVKNRSKLRIFT